MAPVMSETNFNPLDQLLSELLKEEQFGIYIRMSQRLIWIFHKTIVAVACC